MSALVRVAFPDHSFMDPGVSTAAAASSPMHSGIAFKALGLLRTTRQRHRLRCKHDYEYSLSKRPPAPCKLGYAGKRVCNGVIHALGVTVSHDCNYNYNNYN